MEGLTLVAVHPESEILVTAIVGMMGIRPTVAAIKAGKKLHLGNKETLSDGRTYHHSAGKEYHVPILLVDSEHSDFPVTTGAMESSRNKNPSDGIRRPFRGKTRRILGRDERRTP